MVDIIRDIEDGKGKEGDVDFLLSVSDGIFGNTFCPLADGSSMMVAGAVKKFRDEFEYHIKNKKCMVAS